MNGKQAYIILFEYISNELGGKIFYNLNDLIDFTISLLINKHFECYEIHYTKGTLTQFKFFNIKKENLFKNKLKEEIKNLHDCDYLNSLKKELEEIEKYE